MAAVLFGVLTVIRIGVMSSPTVTEKTAITEKSGQSMNTAELKKSGPREAWAGMLATGYGSDIQLLISV